MKRIMWTDILDKLLQYFAPIVFGIISENTNTSIVSIADTIPNDEEPKTLTASAPTPAAPIVWATVLRDNIAANGLSIFFF